MSRNTDPEQPADEAALLTPAYLDTFVETLEEGLTLVRRAVADADRPATGVAPQRLRRNFAGIDLDQPLDGGTTAALEELRTLYLRDTVYYHHPRYLAHLNCPVFVVSLLAEMISGALNTAVETWDQSAGATLIEEAVIDWTARRMGLGAHADGVFTSGGSQSNLMALLLAREERGRGNDPAVAPGRPHVRVLCSECSHFSVDQAAGLLGLPRDTVVPVACDRQRQMCPRALRARMHEAATDNARVLAVVATAGTTDFGSIDPLGPIADLCAEHGAWLHVDAAYGGALLLTDAHRQRLDGIERADSVTLDYHKCFFQPLCCSALVVRERGVLRHLTHHADYLNPREHEAAAIPDLVNKSIQTSRRFDALKMWLTLRVVGPDRIGRMLDTLVERTRALAAHLARDPDTEMAHEPALTTLVFRFRDSGVSADENDACNQAIRHRLSQTGEAVIAATVCNGRRYLKFTLLDPETTLETLLDIHRAIKEHGHALVREYIRTREDTA